MRSKHRGFQAVSNPFYDFAKFLHDVSGQKMKTSDPVKAWIDTAKAYQSMFVGDRKAVRKFCDKVRR